MRFIHVVMTSPSFRQGGDGVGCSVAWIYDRGRVEIHRVGGRTVEIVTKILKNLTIGPVEGDEVSAVITMRSPTGVSPCVPYA